MTAAPGPSADRVDPPPAAGYTDRAMTAHATKPPTARRGAFKWGLLIGLVLGVAAFVWWSRGRSAPAPGSGA